MMPVRGAEEAIVGIVETVHLGHRQVEQHDVGLQLGDHARALPAVGGLADHLQARIGLQRVAQQLAHLGDVVAQDDTDRGIVRPGRSCAASDDAVLDGRELPDLHPLLLGWRAAGLLQLALRHGGGVTRQDVG